MSIESPPASLTFLLTARNQSSQGQMHNRNLQYARTRGGRTMSALTATYQSGGRACNDQNPAHHVHRISTSKLQTTRFVPPAQARVVD
ncbi:hypothetical protein N7468_007987 [Penicillium chermesinum]|uniref:Uncharacterized protein n=1 Tax=Penicillium chermesinum TaxID=63820 RepID=A0A9W9TJF3_9EURO|nr:uncharacterized protein N7468_007987 [Penicillium chermesinum]KAJ5223445.1 hypothetical protein N7468_007987 [Penicillium chermesinum]